jgi:hypothetical protein
MRDVIAEVDYHLDKAEEYLTLLDEQVGKPSIAHHPQTTNQAIVLVLKELTAAVKRMKHENP